MRRAVAAASDSPGDVDDEPERSEQARRLRGAQAQRSVEDLRVAEVDASLVPDGLNVHVEEVVDVASREPAELQHLEVADDLPRGDAEGLGDGRDLDAGP